MRQQWSQLSGPREHLRQYGAKTCPWGRSRVRGRDVVVSRLSWTRDATFRCRDERIAVPKPKTRRCSVRTFKKKHNFRRGAWYFVLFKPLRSLKRVYRRPAFTPIESSRSNLFTAATLSYSAFNKTRLRPEFRRLFCCKSLGIIATFDLFTYI